MAEEQITYSLPYSDDVYEYRHVILPQDLAELIPRGHLLTETEWRNLGVRQSANWVNYMRHPPEPHVLLFRRLKTKRPTGNDTPVTTNDTPIGITPSTELIEVRL